MIYILNSRRNRIGAIADQISLLWVSRLGDIGEFEIVVPANAPYVDLLQIGYYLEREEPVTQPARLMYIESIAYQSDINSGNRVKAKGRSLEVILAWMSVYEGQVWYKLSTTLSESMYNILRYCRAEEIGLQFDTGACPYLSIAQSTIQTMVYGKQDNNHTGECKITPWDFLRAIYEKSKIGFKILQSRDPDTGSETLKLELYEGVDKSNTVFLSQSNGGILSSEYKIDYSNIVREAAVVAQSFHFINQDTVTARAFGVPTGPKIDKRRVVIMSDDIPASEGNQKQIFTSMANKCLDENTIKESFVCTINPNKADAAFGTDYTLGDTIKIEDGLGHRYRAKITEAVYTEDEHGTMLHPTLEIIEKLPKEATA